MTSPIPLSDPDGKVYMFACGNCHNVYAGSESWGKDWPDEDEVARRREMTEKCCTCERCGAVTDHRWPRICDACRPAYDAEEEARRAKMEAYYAEVQAAVDASLLAAKDRDFAMVLRCRMSEISEDEWSASWLIGLEFSLWNRVVGGNSEALRRLSEKAGGWWHWPESSGEALFVPTDEWLKIYKEGPKVI